MAKTSKLGQADTAVISVRVKAELKRKIEYMAVAHRKTVNAYCTRLFINATTASTIRPIPTEARPVNPYANSDTLPAEADHSPSYTRSVYNQSAGFLNVNPRLVKTPKFMDSIVITSPATLYELRRIGNNINQIARAVNGGKCVDQAMAFDILSLNHLFDALADKPEYHKRLDELRRIDLNDPTYTQARQQLQRGHSVRPA